MRQIISVSLDWDEAEHSALQRLAKEKSLNKSALLRQALRTYYLLDKKLSTGGRLYFLDHKGTMTPLDGWEKP